MFNIHQSPLQRHVLAIYHHRKRSKRAQIRSKYEYYLHVSLLTLEKPIPQQQPPPAPATPVAQPMQTTTPVASGRKKTSRKGTGLSTTGYTIFSAEHNKQVSGEI